MDANTTTSSGSGYLQPALIGGVVTGVLSALPLVSVLNACCCLWVIIGGLIASYLLQQNRSTPISAADGALVGLLAGIIGAVVSSLISIPLGLVMAPVMRSLAERALNAPGAAIPPEVRSIIENYASPRDGVGVFGQVFLGVIGFFISLIVFSVVSTLSGLLGAAFFARRPPPAPASAAV